MKRWLLNRYISIRYFFQTSNFKSKVLRNFPKLIEVVLSCQTKEQCDSGLRYITLYIHQREINAPNNVFNDGNKLIIGRLIDYLQDTRQHSEYGFHNKEDGEIQKTWPDLNDYLNDVIGVRFAKVWVAGRPSVIGVI